MDQKIRTLLIILLTLLLIGLFWFTVYLGKDEFEAFQAEQEEEIESEERALHEDGLTFIKLTAIEQKNSGIKTELTKSSSMQSDLSAYGVVVSVNPLIEAKSRFIALQSDVMLAKTGSNEHLQQYNRLKALNQDDKNVSDQVVNEALAQVKSDQARINAAKLQLTAFRNAIELEWGKSLASLLDSQSKPYLNGLLNHKYALIKVTLPHDQASPHEGDVVTVRPLGSEAQSIKAYYVDIAHQVDAITTGKTYYFSAPAQQLREGMRLAVLAKDNHQQVTGSIIPNDSVIWYAGKPWVYVKQDNERFLRKPINAEIEIGDSWFDESLNAGTEIVTVGAQLLLSEEFKYLIKNENDD